MPAGLDVALLYGNFIICLLYIVLADNCNCGDERIFACGDDGLARGKRGWWSGGVGFAS